ncbi:MAG: glycosyltransferase family 39 protein [Bacteroidales bacterium]|nr:glycosyltransferase family 39 protein [Bacteroidales bacterium]
MNKTAISDFIAKNKYILLFVAIGVVYFLYQFVDIMEVDAAQYALISMEMSFTKSFLHVYELTHDYLDKPPLLFWLSSFSFMILGVSNIAYKLPSVLIAILGIYSTYRLAKGWYSKKTALYAALILATSQAMFLLVNDIRTDTMLLGFSIFAIWQISEFLAKQKWINLILAAMGIGGAMLSKGPLGLVLPAAAVGSDLLLKRQWKNIFKYQWLIMLVIVAAILVPMSYGLYTQFDLHPEKTVYGLKGPSGLKFFYWTQSFGRITGQSNWQDNSGHFYFFHTIIWDFQPWVLLFIPALILKIRKLFIQRFRPPVAEEYMTLAGFVLFFIAFSFSHYKLPHYIFVLFPFAAIITADFFVRLSQSWQSRLGKIQFGLMHAFWLLMILDFLFIFPPKNPVLPVIIFVLYLVFVFVFRKLKFDERIMVPTIITAVALNLLMAVNFYPRLLNYQANSQAGRYITEHKIPLSKVSQPCDKCYSFDFYAKTYQPADTVFSDAKQGDYIFVSEQWLKKIVDQKVPFKIIKTFPDFRVTHLNPTFLLKKTREEALTKKYLIEVE